MQKFLTGVAVLTLAACSTTSAVVTPIAQLKASSDVTVSSLLALNAICGAEASKGGTANLKLTAGMGTGGFKVDTTSKEAQDWFNYSMALSHAFYHEDAKAAMRKALEKAEWSRFAARREESKKRGKLRGKLEVAPGSGEDVLRPLAFAHADVVKFTDGKTVRKFIVVPDKLVNIVVSD